MIWCFALARFCGLRVEAGGQALRFLGLRLAFFWLYRFSWGSSPCQSLLCTVGGGGDTLYCLSAEYCFDSTYVVFYHVEALQLLSHLLVTDVGLIMGSVLWVLRGGEPGTLPMEFGPLQGVPAFSCSGFGGERCALFLECLIRSLTVSGQEGFQGRWELS